MGIAIIDQPLLRDHVEYANRIKSYDALEVEGVDVKMHGPPVCSIAVGKTCGVAPQASLHYYAVPPEGFNGTSAGFAQGAFITSALSLGTFNAGDQLSLRFVIVDPPRGLYSASIRGKLRGAA